MVNGALASEKRAGISLWLVRIGGAIFPMVVGVNLEVEEAIGDGDL